MKPALTELITIGPHELIGPDKLITIGSMRSKSPLYAVVISEDYITSIFADGSLIIKWESGEDNDLILRGRCANPDEDAPKAVSIFAAIDAASKIHIVPLGFTSREAMELWFRSIGLEVQSLTESSQRLQRPV
jgi:hypothetical protein